MADAPPSPPSPPIETGLSEGQVQRQRALDGPNRLPAPPPRGLARAVLDAALQPMFGLLLSTATLYAALGSLGDAGALLLSVALVGGISLYQQRRTERVLAALKDLASPRCRVLREGQVQRVASLDLVRGDLLLLAEGDRLACDAQVRAAQSLLLDESLLTGESQPVPKAVGETVHAGTLVLQGDASACVSATGAHTTLGRLGASLAEIVPPPSRAQRELQRLAQAVAIAAALICLAAATTYGLRQGDWVQGLLVGLTLAMALIPEEFAVVWTVVMALGAWRLARLQVLTRQPQAIEALGSASVLCVDKTGTLTQNRMALLELASADAHQVLDARGRADAALAPLLRVAAQAGVALGIEPMDRAIQALAQRSLPDTQPPATLLRRDGLRPGQPYVLNAWRDADGPGRWAIKGAPEAVQALCEMAPDEPLRWRTQAAEMAARGLRVLAVAEGQWPGSAPPERPAPLRWLGLLGFADPLRPEVPEAMRECRAAGIRVVMVTGDAALTARAIAEQAGLHDGEAARVVTGPELAAMSEAALDEALAQVSIFARIAPEQKLRIVRALQRAGEVVAMTGDGVNDAPALRAADIGVAMGQRGSDVAREAAQLVLLDDSFAALVAAVRMGRRIFINLRKSVGYLLAVHLPIVGLSLIPVLLGGPLLLLPLHVVLLELIIDPACSLVFEAETEPANCMQQPPRPASVGLLSWHAAARAMALGALGLLVVVAAPLAAQAAGAAIDTRRALALAALVGSNLALLVWFRRGGQAAGPGPRNPVFAWLLLGLSAACGAVLSLEPLTRRFGLPWSPAVQFAGIALLLAALLLGARRVSRDGFASSDKTPA